MTIPEVSPTGFYKFTGPHGASAYVNYNYTPGVEYRAEGDLVLWGNDQHVGDVLRVYDLFCLAGVDVAAELYPVISVSSEHIRAADPADHTWSVRSLVLGPKYEWWNETTQRLFAADCAERALLRERVARREPDPRSWEAVAAARQFVRGEISVGNLGFFWAQARYAAGDSSTAFAARAACAAAKASACSAAGNAAWEATRVPRHVLALDRAEQRWQGARLLAYARGEARQSFGTK